MALIRTDRKTNIQKADLHKRNCSEMSALAHRRARL